jgi:hypothetical protein
VRKLTPAKIAALLLFVAGLPGLLDDLLGWRDWFGTIGGVLGAWVIPATLVALALLVLIFDRYSGNLRARLKRDKPASIDRERDEVEVASHPDVEERDPWGHPVTKTPQPTHERLLRSTPVAM